MKPTNNLIALLMAMMGCALVVFVFAESRNDPGLRMAALVAATSTGAGLLAIASTLLTGKDVTKPDPADLPTGSRVTNAESTTVQLPPIPPENTPPKS